MTDHYTHSPPNAATAGRTAKDYWSANLRIIGICLAIWALVSFGFAIILRPLLSGIAVGGTDLGFWFAQQGSILVFVVLIFFYAWRMNRLDRESGVDEEV
jgi:putative solute:sodium symporter small subunit